MVLFFCGNARDTGPFWLCFSVLLLHSMAAKLRFDLYLFSSYLTRNTQVVYTTCFFLYSFEKNIQQCRPTQGYLLKVGDDLRQDQLMLEFFGRVES